MNAAGKKLRGTGAILLAALCSGCLSFSGEFGTRIPANALLQVRDGETTREEINSWFGPPSAFYNPTFLDVILEDQEDIESHAPVLNDVYTYRYIENKTSLFFIPILFARIDAVATSETLVVFFDENGRVEHHAYRRDEH